MDPIEGKLFSPFQKRRMQLKPNRGLHFEYEEKITWERWDATVNQIRASPGFKVSTFRELMDEVAYVTINNRNFEMFYRGQQKDYLNNQAVFYKGNKAKSTIYPAICRPDRKVDGSPKYSIKNSQIIKRYNNLNQMIDIVREGKNNYYTEIYYSLFQHYNILPTPFIDITQSLRVAATFALRDSKTGYLFVFGLPYPNQSISFFADIGLLLIKLQNIVPIKAKRPRYQEGFLVGKYPISPTKTNSDDLANRMVAKFLLDNAEGNFWDNSFQPLPEDVLYPENDETEMILLEAKKKFEQRS